jgi:hypothetical protein
MAGCRIRQSRWFAITLVIASSLLAGCRWNVDTARRVAAITSLGSRGVQVRQRSRSPLETPLAWWSRMTGYGGVQPDDRTLLFLRTNALEEQYRTEPQRLLVDLLDQCRRQPDPEQLHAVADVAWVEAGRSQLAGNEQQAGQLLATAVAASYQYLFDSRLDHQRNVYDPVFRSVCDLYNQSLEGLLRIMRQQDALKPGGMFTATTLEGRPLQVTVSVSGRWSHEQFEKFEFVNDYRTEGLRNVHLTYGLGVPLIAIRQTDEVASRPEENYYPADLSMPLTAFVRTSVEPSGDATGDRFQIQLIDPLEKTAIKVHDRFAPLESDITTPLAYYLDDPLLDANWFATAALLNGDFARQFGGLYMLEPFDPTKIPVVMVHGFWSSPMTWTEMFNDLRAVKSIRDNYQFWFYLYPSGQPFWFSARQMRTDLQEARQSLDPGHSSRALAQMVLVGHSMGGLVSRLQTINSYDHFWKLVSDQPFQELKGDPVTRQRIRDTLFFTANPSIARVVTIGTPHQGSQVANSVNRWLSEKLFSLPSNLTSEYSRITNDNPRLFKSDLLKITTSTDSLAPDSEFFGVMMKAETSPRVRFHNVIGIHKSGRTGALFGSNGNPSDGVVSVDSASYPGATSEIRIEAEHSSIHQNPRAILEVRRILTEHLYEVFGIAGTEDLPPSATVIPVSHSGVEADPRISRENN